MFTALGCDSIDSITCNLADVFEGLDGGDIKTILMFGVGGVIAVVAIFCSFVKSISNTKAREATKREIAAYVAEGTIKPEDAVAMLKAGNEADEDSC